MKIDNIKMHRLLAIRADWLSVFQYMFVICIILNMRSIWLHTPSITWADNFVTLLMGLSVVGGSIARHRFYMRKLNQCFILIITFVIFIGIFYLVDPLKSNTVFKILMQLLTLSVYCMIVEESVNITLKKFANVVFIIAIISLFFWLFGSVLKVIKPTGILYTTWTGNDTLKRVDSYYGIYFETQSANVFGLINYRIVRNTAIFTEAPMASFVFLMAFLAELFRPDKINRKICLLFAVSVLSAMSTTGITALIVALCLKYVFSRSKSKGAFSFKLLILPAMLFAGMLLFDFFISQKLGTSSGATRMDDFVAGYKAWLDSPIFGNGYGNTRAYQKYMSSFRKNNLGFSNSPMLVLAYGGIYLFIPYILSAFIGISRLIFRRDWTKVFFYSAFLYTFIITVVPFQMLTFYLFFCLAREGQSNPQTIVHYNVIT